MTFSWENHDFSWKFRKFFGNFLQIPLKCNLLFNFWDFPLFIALLPVMTVVMTVVIVMTFSWGGLRGTRYRHFLECRRLRNVKILPLHPTSPRGHQKMRQDLPHLSVPFTKREIEAKYFILSPLSAAPALFLSFFHRNVNYCSFMKNTCSSITYKVGNK